jgi:mono/diheme cytochrome c family protein
MNLGTRIATLVLSMTAAATFAASPSPTELEHGEALYLAACARCHGADATGDGPDGAVLDPRPTNLRDPEFLGSLSDADLVGSIRQDRPKLRPRVTASPRNDQTRALARFLRRLPAVRWQLADPGRRIYLGRCSPCHGRYGHAESPGPSSLRDLSDPSLQAAVDDRELRRLARHARRDMPPLFPPLDDTQADEVTAFLRLLSPGYELYYRYCVTCHGAHGASKTGDKLHSKSIVFDARYFATKSDDALEEKIWHMLRDARPSMPHFESQVSADDVAAIVRYLRSLSPSR